MAMERPYRKGDVATIEVVVDTDEVVFRNDGGESPSVFVKPVGYYDRILIDRSKLRLARPVFLSGDPVECDGRTGTILAMTDTHVWVKLDKGGFNTWHIADVSPASNNSEAADD